MPFILAGKIGSSKDALRNGLVDRLFPEKTFFENAVEFAKEVASGQVKRKKKSGPWFLEKTAVGRALVFRTARKNVLKQTKGHYPAPLRIIDLIAKTYSGDVSEGFKQESEAFAELQTEVADLRSEVAGLRDQIERLVRGM